MPLRIHTDRFGVKWQHPDFPPKWEVAGIACVVAGGPIKVGQRVAILDPDQYDKGLAFNMERRAWITPGTRVLGRAITPARGRLSTCLVATFWGGGEILDGTERPPFEVLEQARRNAPVYRGGFWHNLEL